MQQSSDRPPADDVPAPWTVECDAVVWVARAGRAARSALPPSLRGSRVVAVVGAAVRYRSTPVGPYDEVLGAVVCLDRGRPWGSVPFIAVDSPSSLLAGRANWGLPKTLGVLDGSPGQGRTTARGADPDPWRVTVSARVRGPAVPVAGRTTLRQEADGPVLVSPLAVSGRLRPALVRVGVGSEGSLADWLRPGRHAGAVLTGVRLTLGEPGSGAAGLSRAATARRGRRRGRSGRRRAGCPAR